MEIVGAFFIGLLSAFVWPLLRDIINERKNLRAKSDRKTQILRQLDAIAADVMAAVQVEPHGVQNKGKWVSRLQEFANQYDDILGPIAGYVKRISYKIEDSTFDHLHLGEPPYCCDEVEIDLTLLKLCILPIIAKELGWSSEILEKEEKRHLRKIWEIFQEVGLPAPLNHPDPEKWHEERAAQYTEKWYEEWKTYKFKIQENLAMATYINHERKEFEQMHETRT